MPLANCLFAMQRSSQKPKVFKNKYLIKNKKKSVWTFFVGAGGQNRTGDLRVTSALLYRLSHTSMYYKVVYNKGS